MPKKAKSKKPVKQTEPKLPRFITSSGFQVDDDGTIFMEIYERATRKMEKVIILNDDCEYETAEDDLETFTMLVEEWMERNQHKAMSGSRDAFAKAG